MRAVVKTLRGRETIGRVDLTEINFRRDILTQTVFQVLTGSFQSGFRGKPCGEEGRRERERKSITNDTTQRYVDDVVRKCVEVKTSRGHCTTGFGDLVEINFTPPASQQRPEHVGIAGALVDPVCGGGKPQYSKYLVIHEGWRCGTGWSQSESTGCRRRERVRRVSELRGTRRITLRDRSGTSKCETWDPLPCPGRSLKYRRGGGEPYALSQRRTHATVPRTS